MEMPLWQVGGLQRIRQRFTGTIPRSMVTRRLMYLVSCFLVKRVSFIVGGPGTNVGCSRPRWRRDYEFASHTVGLVWDTREQGWRCLICGCRVYEAGVDRLPGGEQQRPPLVTEAF